MTKLHLHFGLYIILAFLICACTSPGPGPTTTSTSTPILPPANTSARTPAYTYTPTFSPTSSKQPSVTATLVVTVRRVPVETPEGKPSTPTPRPTKTPTHTQTATIDFFHLPTFDPARAITRTSAPPAKCPAINPDLQADPDSWLKTEGLVYLMDERVLEFLNAGGSPDAVLHPSSQKYRYIFNSENYSAAQDLTGDGTPELILSDSRIFYVIGCKEGQYQTLFYVTDEPGWLAYIRFILPGDMNLDGIPEIIADEQGGHGYPSSVVSIYEWNGTEFIPLTQDFYRNSSKCCYPAIQWHMIADVSVRDVDGNGSLELLLTGLPSPGTALYSEGLPWRKETDTYAWNGVIFNLSKIEFSPPVYRFQAVQDGDRAALAGNIDAALNLYQQAIFSDQLDGWSLERFLYLLNCSDRMDECGPFPAPDPNEYYRLAAYARYRIMLLHLVRGYLPEAEKVYRTLQEKFPAGQPGHGYAEMAAAFWETYQSTQNMGQACVNAIEYARTHPEDILSYLGNGEQSYYYGAQSLIYTPQDVCPYR